MNKRSGFTIVELLVVIVVIGILAAITIVSYSGISGKATASSLQSDLSNASKLLKLFYIDNGSYPLSLDSSNCPLNPTDSEYCIKSSSGNTYMYVRQDQDNFTLHATSSNGMKYRVTNNTTPTLVADIDCPTGFIQVPGSSTYSTSDFCVMKYEAKQASSTVPISQASGTPWISISQINAASYSQNVSGCTGCHLITEAEWMTIAQNVLKNSINWNDGTSSNAGRGYIYSGHNDSSPSSILAADTDDNNGYSGTGNSSPSNQKRTLILSNGEVIWDFAGNTTEWTQGTITGGQPGFSGEMTASWKDWSSPALSQNSFPSSSLPTSTGLPNISSWGDSQGIGWLYSNPSDASTKGFMRGGNYAYGSHSGILALAFVFAPSGTGTSTTFRVAK